MNEQERYEMYRRLSIGWTFEESKIVCQNLQGDLADSPFKAASRISHSNESLVEFFYQFQEIDYAKSAYERFMGE